MYPSANKTIPGNAPSQVVSYTYAPITNNVSPPIPVILQQSPIPQPITTTLNTSQPLNFNLQTVVLPTPSTITKVTNETATLPNSTYLNPQRPLWEPFGKGGSNTLVSSFNNIFTNTLSTGVINAGIVDADTISTINFYADIVNVDEATISSISTNAIELDGAYLTTANGIDLLLNGIPLATTQNLSSIQDWAIFPAISSIFTTNANNDVGSSNAPFRAGYFSTIYAKDAVIQSTTLTLTETVSSLFANDFFVSTIYAQQGNISSLNVSSVNGVSFSNLLSSFSNISSNVSSITPSNWYLFPAQSTVSFAQLLPGTPTPIYSLVGACNITCANLTAQLSGFPTPSYGGTITGLAVNGVVGTFGSVQGGDATFSNVTETTNVDIYGVNRPAGFNALYVEGGVTMDAGSFIHGITLGTNTFGVSLNRIDLLPIGTQSHITWGAMAMIAGLGLTIDAGLGINIASGLVVDVLANDVQLRANDGISLDADDSITLVTGGDLNMTANNINQSANTLNQTANSFTYTDSNFTVNSSNKNVFNASIVTQGTPLPPSTIGFYSTFQQNTQIQNTPFNATITSEKLFGLYENISTLSWVVTSNISTIYTPSTTGILSSYTSSFTSSFERSYSTLALIQSFPAGQINMSPSTLLLQHADLIELDTKPFPIFTTLSPGLSSIVSSLYTYEAITDGTKYSEVGEIIQTIVPVLNTYSTFNVSTGVSSGTVLSTLTSSFFSTLVSDYSFTSTLFNTMLFNSNGLTANPVNTNTVLGTDIYLSNVSSIRGYNPNSSGGAYTRVYEHFYNPPTGVGAGGAEIAVKGKAQNAGAVATMSMGTDVQVGAGYLQSVWDGYISMPMNIYGATFSFQSDADYILYMDGLGGNPATLSTSHTFYMASTITQANQNLIANTRQPFIQYGKEATSGGTGNQTVTLPTAYANTDYVVQVSMEDTNPAQMSADITGTNTFDIYWANAGGGNHTIAWTTFGDL